MANYYSNHLGVTFGGKHSFRTYGLYPRKKFTISAPEVKTHYIDVPGASGSIDMTTTLTGYLTYEDREGEFQFTSIADRDEWDAINASLLNNIHGRYMSVILDEEPDVILRGRLFVQDPSWNKYNATLTVKGRFEPFKRARYGTTGDWIWDTFNFLVGVIREYGDIPVSGSKAVTIVSSPMGGLLTITTSAAMSVTIDGTTYQLASGRNTLANYALPQDYEEVVLNFSGTGTVSISFTAGRL